jgi:hypothetical protein
MILAFLRKEGPQEEVDALFGAIPGAADAAAEEDSGGASGGTPGTIGGGLMGLAGQLTSLGLGMGAMQTIGRHVFAMRARRRETRPSVKLSRRSPESDNFSKA